MPIKYAEVEDLGIATVARGWLLSIAIVDREGPIVPTVPAQTDWLALGKCRYFNRAGLISVFVVRAAASAHPGAEMVFGALDGNADDGRVPVRMLQTGCATRRARVRLRLISRQFVMLTLLAIGRERGGRQMRYKILVESASLGQRMVRNGRVQGQTVIKNGSQGIADVEGRTVMLHADD